MKTQNSKKLANPWLPSPNACQNKKEITTNYELYFYGRKNLRADVSKYRPEVYKTEKSKILKKIHKVALGKLLT